MPSSKPDQTARADRLRRMLSPTRAVFVGGAALAPAIAYCRARGFAGPIDVVNPRRGEVAGVRCRPSVEALEKPPTWPT